MLKWPFPEPNPGPCLGPEVLTLHGPRASSSPGLGSAPQSTGTLFPAAFMRSLSLRHHSPPRPHPVSSPSFHFPTPTQLREEWAHPHNPAHPLCGKVGARLTYPFTAPLGGGDLAGCWRSCTSPFMVALLIPGLLKSR